MLRQQQLLKKLALREILLTCGYFKQQPCDFGIEKKNFPENSIFYLNQGYQSFKGNKKIYYANMFLNGHVNECLNLPEDLHSYECGDREVRCTGQSMTK